MDVNDHAKRIARSLLPESMYRRVRRYRVARLVQRYEGWRRTGIYGGHELTVHITDPLAEGWYGHDWPTLAELDMLHQLGGLRPGARVFDLGAHQGVVALMLSREVGPAGHVLAVEAEPHNARIGERNRLANAVDNMTILHAAVSDEDGSAFFREGLNGSMSGRRPGSIEVPAYTVDTLAVTYGSPDVVFMDIEGHEGRALASASLTIGSGATFFVEVHVDSLAPTCPDEIVRRFSGRDIYIADAAAESYGFTLYNGCGLPDHRFYLIAD